MTPRSYFLLIFVAGWLLFVSATVFRSWWIYVHKRRKGVSQTPKGSMMKVDLNSVITLSGKSQKGKNRIKEHGTKWLVFEIRDRVLFSNQSGPWLLLISISTNHIRWIHLFDDVDFSLIT